MSHRVDCGPSGPGAPPHDHAKRADPHPVEVEQRTAELARGLEALVWFQDWAVRVLSEVGASDPLAGQDFLVGPERPATKVQWVLQAWALEEELHELLREVGWKPWKATPPPAVEEVISENADVLAFLGNILRYILALPGTKIRPHELADAYARVVQRNVARFRGQVPGYVVPSAPARPDPVIEGAKAWASDKTNGPTPDERVDGGGSESYEQSRPASMWSELVERDGYSGPRFRPIGLGEVRG